MDVDGHGIPVLGDGWNGRALGARRGDEHERSSGRVLDLDRPVNEIRAGWPADGRRTSPCWGAGWGPPTTPRGPRSTRAAPWSCTRPVPGTVLAGGVLQGVTLAAGQQLQVRVQVEGTAPTTVRARAWRAGSAEPTTWQVTTTDTNAGLQAAGAVGLTTYLSSAATNGPVTVRWDDLSARPVGGTTPPTNAVPTASFTRTTSGLTLNVNGSASSDPDGTIASHAWSFGDGGTGYRCYDHAYLRHRGDLHRHTDRHGRPGCHRHRVGRGNGRGHGRRGAGGGRVRAHGQQRVGRGGQRRDLDVDRECCAVPVSGGAGVHSVPAASTDTSILGAVSSTSTDMSLKLALGAVPNGPVYVSVVGRRVGSTDYGARAKVLASGAVELHITRTGAVLAGGAVSGLTLAAGQQLQVRVQVQGISPTTVRARPGGWVRRSRRCGR